MATRRLDREDHVKQHLAQMLAAWQERTGCDMAAAAADLRIQQCTTLLIDLLGEAEKVNAAAAVVEDRER